MRISDWSSDVCSSDLSVIGLGIVYSVSQMSIVQGSILSWIVCAGLIALETKLSKDVAILPPSAAESWSGSDCAAEAMAGARLEVAAMMKRSDLSQVEDRKSTRLKYSH